MILDPVRRLRYLIGSANRLPAWRDDRFFRASSVGGYWRLEFLGLPGVGKSYFNDKLASAFGEATPSKLRLGNLSPEYEAAFEKIFVHKMGRYVGPRGGRLPRMSKVRNFLQVMELDQLVQSRPGNEVFSTASGLVHWSKPALMDFVLTDPDCVRDVLSGRVVVYCTADDPGRRSLSGLVRRGTASASQVTDEKIHARTQADAQLHRLAQSLAELGIPVLELNLDAPVDENLSRVAFFLTAAGIHSPKINRFAARANRAGRDPILFPGGTRESGGD